MKKFMFFLSFVFIIGNAMAEMIGEIDHRQYLDWNSASYDSYVKIGADGRKNSFCTGQFVSKKIILTNSHCIPYCSETSESKCYVTTSDGKKIYVKLVMGTDEKGMKEKEVQNYITSIREMDSKSSSRITTHDFAFLETIGDYERSKWFSVYSSNYVGDVTSAGFGSLRILTDKEIHKIKEIYVNMRKMDDYVDYEKNMKKVLPEYDGTSYKDWEYQSKINQMDDDYYSKLPIGNFKDFEKELGKNGISEIFQDGENFKVHIGCQIMDSNKNNLQHNCETSPGNSGGGLIIPGNILVGIINSGSSTIGVSTGKLSLGVPSNSFYPAYKERINE